MFKSAPKVVALLLAGYLISSPVVAMASNLATTSPKNKVTELPKLPSTETPPATKSESKASEALPKADSKVRVGAKQDPAIKKVRLSKKLAHSKATKPLSKAKVVGAGEDCDACHDQCLVAGLTCIAISIATGCLPCGGICLAGQLACGLVCNGTTACKQVATQSPPVN